MASSSRPGATPGKVAGLATRPASLDTSSTALIGLFGPNSDMAALFRMANGRTRMVRAGARLPSGRVIGIDETGVRVQSGARVRHYRLPGG